MVNIFYGLDGGIRTSETRHLGYKVMHPFNDRRGSFSKIYEMRAAVQLPNGDQLAIYVEVEPDDERGTPNGT